MIDEDRVVQIAFQWLGYNRFRDRFCPQEPILDEPNACWIVPIWIVYADGRGAFVANILVSRTSISVKNPVSVDEMKRISLEVAAKLLTDAQLLE